MVNIFAEAAPAATSAVDAATKTGGSFLVSIDWVVIGIFFAIVLGIGIAASRSAGKNTKEFFLGGRGMPWWLLGVSMVACTFSCDTPNLVTGMVRGGGVVSNWAWWAFLITGMITVFIYAQLWRRSKVMTDLEFYEMRYSGKSAAFIRGFRALYLGIFFNCLIMGTVTLAAIKIGQVVFDLDPLPTVIYASIGVVLYATLGGIKGVIWADFFQYSIAMFGAVYAAVVVVNLPEVGGMDKLLAHDDIVGKLTWMPDFSTWLSWVPLLLIPVAVQWWSVWYPGAEPGGGGYIAQRMLAAKDEKNAIGATLFFNFMHYAMRPWPWIIVALASIICYPTLAEIKAQFPGIDPAYLKQDIAYPVMMTKLGPGFLGLVIASLIAAYMSTIGTHLNWGSSYAVNDFYQRFIKPKASQKELVLVGRICTVVLMGIAAVFALTFLEDANQAFEILLLSGAGTGAIYLARWFWWRINAWTEIISMVAASVVAFWIVLGVGSQGTLEMYVGTSAVADRVAVVEGEGLAESISKTMDKTDKDVDGMEESIAAKVEAWRAASKDGPLARDRSRLIYDKAVKKQTDLKKTNTVLALLKKKGGVSFETPLKPEAAVVKAIADEKAAAELAAKELLENDSAATPKPVVVRTYATVQVTYPKLKAAKETASDTMDTVDKAYETELATATAWDDKKLVAARVSRLEAIKAKNLATKTLKSFQKKFATTVAVAGKVKPAWFDGINTFVAKHGGDAKAIITGGVIYVYDPKIEDLKFGVQLLICVIVVTLVWILTTLVTPAVSKEKLREFYKVCHPGGPGWRKVVKDARAEGIEIDVHDYTGSAWKMPIQLLCVFLGCVAIYCSLFSVGSFVYGNTANGSMLAGAAVVATLALFKCFGKLGAESSEEEDEAREV
jgi:SSS family solute:Na+ symporter